jgi:hypothetical protein
MTVHTTNSEQFSGRKKAEKKQKNYQAANWSKFEKLTEPTQQPTKLQEPQMARSM